METNDLNSGSLYRLFKEVNEQIKNWDLEARTGYGSYVKHHSIAYLDIKMYKTVSDRYALSQVIWNATDTGIMKWHSRYRSDVEKALIFFIQHICALKGESIYLTFEINDAAFDFTSDRFHPFEGAAVLAIINCFDGKGLPEYRQKNIKTFKGNLERQIEYSERSE